MDIATNITEVIANDSSFNTPASPVPAKESHNERALREEARSQYLEKAITQLAAHIHSATWRLLELIREYDESEAWYGPGLNSVAHWLNWKCGMNLGAARERVRVAHALPDLPKISEKLRRGEISYSKVRAMTRVATVKNEDFLLSIAKYGTAAHVERVVRNYRTMNRNEALTWDNERHYQRKLVWYFDDAGYLVLRGRFTPEAGAVIVRALQLAKDHLWEESKNVSAEIPEQKNPANPIPYEYESADAMLRVSEGFLTGAGHEIEPEELTEPKISSFDDDKPKVCDSCNHVHPKATKTAYVSSDAIAIPDAITMEVVDKDSADSNSGSKSASETEEPKNTNNPKNASKPKNSNEPGSFSDKSNTSTRKSTGGDRYLVHVHTDINTLKADGDGPQSVIDDNANVSAETSRRLACDASVVHWLENHKGEPLSIGRKTRTIPPSIRRALQRRDLGCRFPGCTCTHYVDAHHIKHWADGGETSMKNLVLLCRKHHRFVHEEGFEVHPRRGGRIDFTDKRGKLIPESAAGRFRGNVSSLVQENVKNGIRIDAKTGKCHWGGERMDDNDALTVMCQLE